MTIKKKTVYWYRNTAKTEIKVEVLHPGEKQKGQRWISSEDQRAQYVNRVILEILDEDTIRFNFVDSGKTSVLSGQNINDFGRDLDMGFKEDYSIKDRLDMILTGKDRGFSRIQWEEGFRKGKER